MLKAIADDLEDAIEADARRAERATSSAALEREIRLEIDPDRLAAYSLTIPEILRLIPSENVNISAGGLETPGTKFNVRVPAEFVEPEEVDHLLLADARRQDDLPDRRGAGVATRSRTARPSRRLDGKADASRSACRSASARTSSTSPTSVKARPGRGPQAGPARA